MCSILNSNTTFLKQLLQSTFLYKVFYFKQQVKNSIDFPIIIPMQTYRQHSSNYTLAFAFPVVSINYKGYPETLQSIILEIDKLRI